MLATVNKIRPTQQDAYAAMDLLSAYFNTHQPTVNRRHKAFQQKARRRVELAAQCDETAQALEQRLREVLPKEHHQLLGYYSLLNIAWYARATISDDSAKMLRQMNEKARRLLKSKARGAKRKGVAMPK